MTLSGCNGKGDLDKTLDLVNGINLFHIITYMTFDGSYHHFTETLTVHNKRILLQTVFRETGLLTQVKITVNLSGSEPERAKNRASLTG